MTSQTTRRNPPKAGTAEHAAIDRSAGLLRRGYSYLLDLRQRWGGYGTAEIRLLGERTTVLSGPAGVTLFYNDAIMQREGALPRPLRRTLFGDGAVHGLDGDEHRHRKAMFVHLLTPSAAEEIAATADEIWRSPARQAAHDPVAVFDEAAAVHCAAVCRWAGVPANAVDRRLGRDLAAIVDGFGSIGPRYVRARRARRRVDRWSRRLVRRARGGHRQVEPGSPLDVIANYTDRQGALLPAKVAAVELVNVLRPTVAVAYFVAFTAHALQTRPRLRDRMSRSDDAAHEAFADEVRRYYPFVPMLAARVRREVVYQGRLLPPGRRVMLDVYGNLHDPVYWDGPDGFDIERFAGVEPDPDVYVPQGGGEVATGHRCPGERVAIELIKVAAQYLAGAGVTDVPNRIPMNRFPTRPLPLA
ncbi:MAG TPA: cytochrome P450 [Jatrophihabitans sp.]|nr:cytochrome P450 [Jatrophihabitans sp.]